MARKPQEQPDLELAEELVFGPPGLALERFTHAQTVRGKTPDFRVLRACELVAFCEVKSPRDDWLDNLLEAATPGEMVGGGRSDPIFNRIARHIQKAASQFDAVNPSREVPNILLFVNHDDMADIRDLRETVTGHFHAESGERIATMTHISDRRIARDKYRIDLYAWLDAKRKRLQGYLFNEAAQPSHVRRLCTLLGLDHSVIRH
jgi:hypothetical protein